MTHPHNASLSELNKIHFRNILQSHLNCMRYDVSGKYLDYKKPIPQYPLLTDKSKAILLRNINKTFNRMKKWEGSLDLQCGIPDNAKLIINGLILDKTKNKVIQIENTISLSILRDLTYNVINRSTNLYLEYIHIPDCGGSYSYHSKTYTHMCAYYGYTYTITLSEDDCKTIISDLLPQYKLFCEKYSYSPYCSK